MPCVQRSPIATPADVRTEMLGRTNDIVTWSAHFTYRGVSVFAVDGCRASRGSDAEKREALEVLSRILKEIVSS